MNRQLKEWIESDLRRYGYTCEKQMGIMTRKECYGYRYSKALRKCRWYKEHGRRFLFLLERIKLQRLSVKFGFQINYSTQIGRGLYLGHMGSIVVNWQAVLGDNVNLAQGVTIGQVNGGSKDGVPHIGNHVWIGANATIAGGITIGDDVMIAPNTFVNFDVPSHSLVIMEKAKTISRENATAHYVENRV